MTWGWDTHLVKSSQVWVEIRCQQRGFVNTKKLSKISGALGFGCILTQCSISFDFSERHSLLEKRRRRHPGAAGVHWPWLLGAPLPCTSLPRNWTVAQVWSSLWHAVLATWSTCHWNITSRCKVWCKTEDVFSFRKTLRITPVSLVWPIFGVCPHNITPIANGGQNKWTQIVLVSTSIPKIEYPKATTICRSFYIDFEASIVGFCIELSV